MTYHDVVNMFFIDSAEMLISATTVHKTAAIISYRVITNSSNQHEIHKNSELLQPQPSYLSVVFS